MKNLSAFVRITILLLLIITIGCAKEDAEFAPAARGTLVESSLNGTLSKSEIISRISEFDGNAIARYGVKFYSITYRTEYLGKPIDTRGLLIIPQGIDTVRLLMYCHGTEIPSKALGANDITPSLYKGGTDNYRDVRNMGLGWATAGYVVFMPDYIGYGLTLGKDHPYLYYPEMFKSNVDGLLAVKSFISQTGLIYDNRLFLTGWSQGGGASLSAHKYIQEQYASQFSIVAGSNLAGPYNFERTTIETLNKKDEDVSIMPIISWAIYSINKFSTLRRPTDQLYSYPVFDQMSSIFTPSNKPSKVFNRVFLSKLLDGTDVKFLHEFHINTFSQGWTPVGKVFLHHGDADDVVPYYNSVDAYNGLTAAGGDITLYTYPRGKHDTELGNFILKTINDFNLLK